MIKHMAGRQYPGFASGVFRSFQKTQGILMQEDLPVPAELEAARAHADQAIKKTIGSLRIGLKRLDSIRFLTARQWSPFQPGPSDRPQAGFLDMGGMVIAVNATDITVVDQRKLCLKRTAECPASMQDTQSCFYPRPCLARIHREPSLCCTVMPEQVKSFSLWETVAPGS